MNPAELRQTLRSVSRRLEAVNAATQEKIYTFTQLYIDPCLSACKECLIDFTAPCCGGGGRDEQSRRKRALSRGRAELNFDFYEDWDEDESHDAHLMGWGNDEWDSLLARDRRQDVRAGQPRGQPVMAYGSTGRTRKSPGHQDVQPDPTIIPSSSYLGFLERLPFKFGGKLRYKPSAADLQENPGGPKEADAEEDLSLGSRGSEGSRQRSRGFDSRSTTNSLSSRGDLIPSDDEADAVPLDDEFAMALGRRTTGMTAEDRNSGRSGSKKLPRTSDTSTRTLSSLSSQKPGDFSRVDSIDSPEDGQFAIATMIPSPKELEKGEEHAKKEDPEVTQEEEFEQKQSLGGSFCPIDAPPQANPTFVPETNDKAAREDVEEDESPLMPDQT